MSQRVIEQSMAQRIAGLELNALLYAGVLPSDVFQKARIHSIVTPIYDINGEILFYRVPVIKNRLGIGYADIAANTAFTQPLLGVSYGKAWNEKAILEEAVSAAKKKQKKLKYDQVRFVAYSYPKLAIQFLLNEKEIVMLEWATWELVPREQKREYDVPPSNFERWSLIEETPNEKHQKNLRKFKKHISNWDDIYPPKSKKFPPEILDIANFEKVVKIFPVVRSRELHYSHNNADHTPCYELRGQLTNVWCVAASVQMILDFYRYNYQQTRIASDLGLGTLSSPNGLPYSRDNDVVTVLENLTSNALDASMNTTPNWNEFVNEINENRPLISFIPGHSRTVAGYTSVRLFNWYFFRGLLVYDPWPPTTGVITRWENFDNQTYRRTFTAHLTLV
ncbi:MAG TPA: C39 family peptidase [Chitinophagaceae bacterium]|jgi:hypothetical protein|nr:C39 family peptidase [Chitinophagaceae bacterium]